MSACVYSLHVFYLSYYGSSDSHRRCNPPEKMTFEVPMTLPRDPNDSPHMMTLNELSIV